MGKTYQITSSDLETYTDSELGAVEKNPLSNWMSLQSQIYVEGVKELYSALNQDPAPDIEQIRENNTFKLLHDLERVAKRQDLNNSRVQLPEFKQEFYEELSKLPTERSQEYHKFIQACCDELTPSRHMTEIVSAQALKKLEDPNLSLNEFKESVEDNIQKYKEFYKGQTAGDHSRGAILYKGVDGKTRHLTVEELMTSKEIHLSEEQRGFVETSWQQGSFFCGWFNGLPSSARIQDPSDTRNLMPYNSPNFTQTFIDASDDNVKVYNRLESSLIDPDSMEIKPFFEASVTVDITDLKGDQFNPGIASAKPKISFGITELDESLALNVPETLKTSPLEKNTSEYIKQEAAIGYVYMLDNNVDKTRAWDSIKSLMGDEKASEYVIQNADLSKLSLDDIEILAQNPPANIDQERKKILVDRMVDRINELTMNSEETSLDPAKYTKAVKLFNKFEPDKNARRGFAEQKLDDYLSAGYVYMLDNNVDKTRAWGSIKILMGNKKASEYVIQNADISKLSLDDIEILAQNPPANIDQERKKILVDRINELTINSEEASLDPAKYTKAVKLFNTFEPDKNTRRGFAEQKLDDYLSAQTSSTLGNKELNYIKDGIVSIMTPSCSSGAERAALESNAGKIIRQCASEKGAKMSFSQKWQKFKDNVSDIANWLIGKENKAKTIMKENAGIITKISKHLSNKESAKKSLPPQKKAKSEGRNF